MKTHYCEVCEGTSHNARKVPLKLSATGLECPARVIRITREPGSAVPGSDPGTR